MNKDNGLYIRVSSELKEAFQKIVEREGYNVSETLEASMKDMVLRGYIPINVRSKMKPHIQQVLTIPEIKMCLENVLFKNKHIKKASLFGSYATGKATSKSDVDIFLEVDDEFGLFDQASVEMELKQELKKNVDVVTGSNDIEFLNHLDGRWPAAPQL